MQKILVSGFYNEPISSYLVGQSLLQPKLVTKQLTKDLHQEFPFFSHASSALIL